MVSKPWLSVSCQLHFARISGLRCIQSHFKFSAEPFFSLLPGHRKERVVQKYGLLAKASLLANIVAITAIAAAWAADVDPYDQSSVPLEVQPTDPALTKIVLVAGRASHGPGEHEFFAGCSVLMKLLQETPGVFPVMARDGWPKDSKTFEGAKSVVFF